MQNHRNSGFVINIGNAVLTIGIWEVGQCQKMCFSLSCKLHGLIFRSLFFMLGIQLKPHNLVGK